MLDDDSILDSQVLFAEAEVLAEFQAACEAEAEQPRQHGQRLKRAAADFCQMQG